MFVLFLLFLTRVEAISRKTSSELCGDRQNEVSGQVSVYFP